MSEEERDDHSRVGYAELLDDQRGATVAAFVERALAVFAAHGITTRRLMTDNHWSYTRNRSLRELLAERHIRPLTTRPRRPRTNGKACVSRSSCRPIGRRGCPLPSV